MSTQELTAVTSGAEGEPARRCRRRPLEPGGPRPSDVLAVFFGAGLAMLAAAAAALVVYVVGGAGWAHWLALHLALLGGVSQLVLGAGQFFVCAFLATTPPSRRLVASQSAIWNCATILVAVGVPTGVQPLVDLGGVLILSGLALFAWSLRAMQGRSLQRARWAVLWYQASASCLGVGALIGVLLAGGIGWRYGSLLGAHLAFNLIGWLGTAIVGTLHTFFPSLTGTQLRFGRLQGATLWLWLVGVVSMAAGAAFSVDPLAVCAWAALLGSAALLTINVLASLRAGSSMLSLPARLVTAGHAFLMLGLTLALITAAAGGATAPVHGAASSALAALLLAGWIGLTVSGSLLHLLTVLARIRHLTKRLPTPRRVPDVAVTGLCFLAVVAWSLDGLRGLSSLGAFALVLRSAAAAVLAALILRAGVDSVRAYLPRPGRTRHPR